MASKRLLVAIHEPEATRVPGISKRTLFFFWGRRVKGGWAKKGWSDHGVRVVFQSDENNKDYAPEVSFRPSETNARIATRVSKAWKRWDQSLADFVSAMNPVIVKITDEQLPGCGDWIYREAAFPADHPLEALAYG